MHTVRSLTDWDIPLEEIAEEYGTPSYVFDVGRVRENCQTITETFDEFTVLYAGKANMSRPVVEAIEREGLGVVCASMYEVIHAKSCGVQPKSLQWTAVNPPDRQLDLLAEEKDLCSEMTITVGALDTLERLGEIDFSGNIYLRLNPGDGLGYAGHGKNPSKQAKFGLPQDRLEKAHQLCPDEATVIGVHSHVGSNLQTEPEIQDYIRIIEEVRNIAQDVDFTVDKVNIGGGIGIPYEGDTSLDYDDVADRLAEVFSDTELSPVMEPGRIIVADAGVLLSTVNTVKETSQTRVVGVDAGLPAITRHAMFDAQHPIQNVTQETAPVEQSVSGPTCTGVDVLCVDRAFSKAEIGDCLAIGNAGAYVASLANNFHNIPRPPVIKVGSGSRELVEEREAIDEVYKH